MLQGITLCKFLQENLIFILQANIDNLVAYQKNSVCKYWNSWVLDNVGDVLCCSGKHKSDFNLTLNSFQYNMTGFELKFPRPSELINEIVENSYPKYLN